MDRGDGTYGVTLKFERAGDYDVHVLLRDTEEITGSPFTVRCMAGEQLSLLRTMFTTMHYRDTTCSGLRAGSGGDGKAEAR